MKNILILCFLMLIPVVGIADGKFYARDRVPPSLPYQRAIISYQNGHELMVVQSKFQGDGKDFAWVIPVPERPRIGTIEGDVADNLFYDLSAKTEDRTVEFGVYFGIMIVLLVLGLPVVIIAARIIYAIKKIPAPALLQGNLIAPILLLVLVLVIIAAIAIPSLITGKLAANELSSERIGIYDIKVIKPADMAELSTWLNENKFKFTADDETAFNNYIRSNWCFVTARINAESLASNQYRTPEGMTNPLVLVFRTKEMVYPLELTATVGSSTEVLLYVIDHHKSSVDSRFDMRFAGLLEESPLPKVVVTSNNALHLGNFYGNYITKFKGYLSTEQMRTDLIINQASDSKFYQRNNWRW
ncbi:MAG: DUF2330 domain-containing protein [Candidatus Brocadiia bacterium]